MPPYLRWRRATRPAPTTSARDGRAAAAARETGAGAPRLASCERDRPVRAYRSPVATSASRPPRARGEPTRTRRLRGRRPARSSRTDVRRPRRTSGRRPEAVRRSREGRARLRTCWKLLARDGVERDVDLVARGVAVRGEANGPLTDGVDHTRVTQPRARGDHVARAHGDDPGTPAHRCPEVDARGARAVGQLPDPRRDVCLHGAMTELAQQLEARGHPGEILKRHGDLLESPRTLAPGE